MYKQTERFLVSANGAVAMNGSERRQAMENHEIKTWKIVLAIVLLLLIYAALDYWTMPAECRKPVEELSQFCLDLRFP